MTQPSYPSIPEQFRETAARFPDQPAIHFMGRQTTFAEFDRQSGRVAAFLAERGLGKGDRVGLYCVNSDFFAVAYFGIVRAGATVVPVNLLLTPREVAYVLNDSGARALIYFEAFEAAVEPVRAEAAALEFTVRIGADGAAGPADFAWPEALGCTAPAPEPAFDSAVDVAAMIYTSGTTGAMLTHRNLVANTRSIREALQLEPGQDLFLLALPMFHAFAATVGMLFPLLHGCALAPLPKFDPGLVADTVEATGATILALVPSMFSGLLRLPDEEVPKFRSLRYAVSGGAAMPVEVMQRFEAKFGKLIYEGDGPTECGPVTCVNPIGGLRKPASVGLPVPGVEMSIRNEAGQELPDDEIGEICVRGANVMKGYWNQPEETTEAFFEDWFRTGDLGHRDRDGYFFIVDRKKDMLIVNGMNVYPRVVEEVLYTLPGVREAAVVGEPHPVHGEIPVAYLSLDEGVDLGLAEVRAFCRDRLGRYQVPRKVQVLPELPKNAAGKILKREIRRAGELERGVDLEA